MLVEPLVDSISRLDDTGERRSRTSDSPVLGSAASPASWMDSGRSNVYQIITSVDQLADLRLDLSAIPSKSQRMLTFRLV